MKGRRVLVVEDDPAVQTLIREALESAGAVVLTADTVSDAVGITGPFELLILDFRLPNGDGPQVARYWAGTPAIYVTGYDQDLGKYGPLPPADVLPKPFSVSDLLQVARRKLGLAG